MPLGRIALLILTPVLTIRPFLPIRPLLAIRPFLTWNGTLGRATVLPGIGALLACWWPLAILAGLGPFLPRFGPLLAGGGPLLSRLRTLLSRLGAFRPALGALTAGGRSVARAFATGAAAAWSFAARTGLSQPHDVACLHSRIRP